MNTELRIQIMIQLLRLVDSGRIDISELGITYQTIINEISK